jgi:predicted nucleic acid-binding protein
LKVVVLDASVAVTACIADDGFEPLASASLVAPPLLWSEVESVLHELAWRGTISHDVASKGLERLGAARIGARRPTRLAAEAWEVADRMGTAKTYDAEYVALARLLSCRLLTLDFRLRRSAASLAKMIGPDEL